MSSSAAQPEGSKRVFATTRWSVVLAARQGGSREAQAALAALCEAYWYPLYAFVRRQGYSPADAEDLTQAFFSRLLEKDDLRQVRPERGKFRSFLLACLQHFLSNERDRAAAQKRGGGRTIRSLDAAQGEDRLRLEPSHEQTPERSFERSWAVALLARALDGLRQEYVQSGRAELFDALQRSLAGEPASLAEIGAALGLSEDAVKSAAYRLRRRYRQRLRDEVALTVAGEDEVEGELLALFAALGQD